MADIRIKDLANTATSVPADAYEVIDSASGGTEKISRDNKRLDMAAAFVAAPGTYNLAPLSGGAVEVAKGGTGAGTAAGARTNLSVNSIDEDAQANALKTTAPAMYFGGSNDYVEVADDAKLSFTDGTDDLPFSVSGWIRPASFTNNGTLASKWNSSKEWRFYIDTNGKPTLSLFGSASTFLTSDIAISTDEWVHISVSYAGAGPNSGVGFASNMDAASIYINGELMSSTATNNAGYTGMVDTAEPVWLGRQVSTYLKGSIRDVKIFNRELTASEVAELARGNDLGFADEWGGALGGIYTQDATPSGEWNANSGTDSDVAGPINGRSNVLGFTVNNTSSSDKYLRKLGVFEVGKRYRLTFDYNIDAANDVVDSIRLYCGGFLDDVYTPTAGTWNTASIEFVAANADLRIYAFDGTSQTVNDPAGDDIFYIDGCKITEIGCLASFSAERYDTSTNKLYDLSDNAFVGTGTSVTLTGMEQPVYETGTWTPAITFGSGSTGITYSAQEGYYTRIGNIVYVTGLITLTAVGSDTGTAAISGLPFTTRNTTNNLQTWSIGLVSNMSGLTASVTALVQKNNVKVNLYDTGATGSTLLTEANFTATSNLRFSGTYQIQ